MTAPSEPRYLGYTLRLRSPAITSTLAGDPNRPVTQPFISGSTIRGAMAARLRADGNSGDDEEFRVLVLSGAVRYLHAYPEIAGARGLPSPASWKCRKEDRDRAHDLAQFTGLLTEEQDAEDFDETWPEESLVSIDPSFVAATASAGARAIARPRTNARLHQQRDRVKGRPWVAKSNGGENPRGAIFAYEYLEADQVFRGAIQVAPLAAQHVDRIKGLLARPVLIGRSRRACYGGDAEVSGWTDTAREYEGIAGGVAADLVAGECFRVMLVSAYIGRHPITGQFDPISLEHELGERVGVAVERRYWAFETLGSFNQKWGLEVPQAQAVAAGAVLILKAARAISLAALRTIEHEGLGERRGEGFGRVVFLAHAGGLATMRLARDEVGDGAMGDGTSPPAAPERVKRQVDFLEERIVLEAARAELDRLAVDLAKEARNIPTNSLLGRLRTLFRAVQDEDSARRTLESLATWCNANNANALKAPARRKLEACNILDSHLLQWLTALSSNDSNDAKWNRLVAAVNGASTITGLGQRHHLNTKSSAEGLLHGHAALLSAYLIDAVLAVLARRNRGGSQ